MKEDRKMRQKRIVISSILISFTILFNLFAVNAEEPITITDNKTGTFDGYDYTLWKDSTSPTSMTLNWSGAFSCQWSNVDNVLFRTGKKFNNANTHQELGNISIDYICDFQPTGNSYLCAYGWMTSPYVEYYIIDSWGTWKPPGGTSKGTINVDGGTYEIYETVNRSLNTAIMESTVYQNWSVRTTKRTSGTISVSEHFKAWESMGMKMGKMYETSLMVEGYQSSGKADVTSMTLNIVPPQTPTEDYIVGDINGDGSTNSIDFGTLRKYLLGFINSFSYEHGIEAADVNGDGSVNSIDFGVYRKYLLGIITEFTSKPTSTSLLTKDAISVTRR